MDLENIILSEINQKKLKSIECHSYVKYKTETHQHRKQYDGYRERGWEVEGRGGQIYFNGRWFDFGWWTNNKTYRARIIETCT